MQVNMKDLDIKIISYVTISKNVENKKFVIYWLNILIS